MVRRLQRRCAWNAKEVAKHVDMDPLAGLRPVGLLPFCAFKPQCSHGQQRNLLLCGEGAPHASARAIAVLAIVPGDGERRRVKSRNVCEGQQRHGNCAIQRSGVAPTRSHWSLCTRGTIMRVATKALLLSAFVLSLSGTAYAQGAGKSGGGGAGAGAEASCVIRKVKGRSTALCGSVMQ